MRAAFVLGVGMTPFGRHRDQTCAELGRAAAQAALQDAGCAVEDLDVVYYANTVQGAIEGQYGMKGQHALLPLGISAPIINVENACTGGSTAFNLAFTQVAGGAADIALAVGAEKLNTDDRARRQASFSQPEDLEQVTQFLRRYSHLAAEVQPPPTAVIDAALRSPFMDAYALNARLHMKRYGTTWRQLAAVSAKNHRHSTLNPLAQYQKDMSIEEVLGARIISWPLTLPMCAPISDGAAAALVCSETALRRLGAAAAVRICSSVLTGNRRRALDEPTAGALAAAARRAFNQAGLAPQDISVAEVHDATAYGEIAQLELLGLCELGQGGACAESGATALGGRIPVNVSGGLESKGHPVAATGLAQLFELVQQLRGAAGARTVPGARYALAACGGGFFNIEEGLAAVTILGAPEREAPCA
ncbi:MAG TPA: thiolase family protein [Steroidobacteraceae bacterium]|nr:thiolase family protein [Steroidobacteraceae bacterium]